MTTSSSDSNGPPAGILSSLTKQVRASRPDRHARLTRMHISKNCTSLNVLKQNKKNAHHPASPTSRLHHFRAYYTAYVQVSKPWFPLVIFALSVANTFAFFLAGGVTALYISTCIAKGPNKFMFVAVLNALGALAGFTVFVSLTERHGVDWVRESYPSIFTSKHWSRTERVMKSFGWGGCVGLSAMPLPLHPLVLLGMLTGMSRASILSAVFLGRLIKYAVFGWVATRSPEMLRYLGVKQIPRRGGDRGGGGKKTK